MKWFTWAALCVAVCPAVSFAQSVPATPLVPAVPAIPAAEAEEPALLTIGSVAPKLDIAKWVKGNEVAELGDGKIYVVEFWATWCPPCKASMPHISELQHSLGDKVTFIGVSDEDEATVSEFFAGKYEPMQTAPAKEGEEAAEAAVPATWNDVVTYTIALDNERTTVAAYLEAAKQPGIPTAFIVGKDGYIEWIGHPMAIEEPLGKVVAGEWDRKAALADYNEAQRSQKIKSEAMASIGQKLREKDMAGAVAIVDKLVEEFPDDQMWQINRLMLIRMSGDRDRLKTELEAIAKLLWEDPMALNQIAWGVASDKKSTPEELAIAKKMAEHACELSEHKDGTIIDTVASIYYAEGNLDEAIAHQKKAIEVSTGPAAEELQKTLETYEKEKADGKPAAAAE